MHLKKVILMTVLHFISMYILMYAMVDTIGNVYPNLNFIYMAALMTAPMLIFEWLLMRDMFENNMIPKALGIAGVIVLIVSFAAIREQTLIKDSEFIRSMIPHHSGAILMCERAVLMDTELRELCSEIVKAQQEEIDQMETILGRL